MNRSAPRIVATLAIALLLALGATGAESLSILLQKGIYAEETEGNLDSAIKIYEQIAAESASNRTLAAQAQYRLAVCYQKLGKKEQAIRVLEGFAQQFPTEPRLIQEARQTLAELGQAAPDLITIRKAPSYGWVMSASPDGRHIVSISTGGTDLVVNDTVTGKSWVAVKGTKDKYADNGAIVSKDGRKIVYDLSGHGLYIANTDGSEVQELYSGREYSLWPVGWREDGQTLVVAFTQANRGGVASLNIHTGKMTEVQNRVRPGRFGYRPKRLSPDGRYLAYSEPSEASGRPALLVLDMDSGTETKVVEKEVTSVAGWSPGGAMVLFLSDRTGVRGLWGMAVTNGKPSGEPQLIRANLGDISPIDVMSDGRFFYYSETNSTETVFIASADLQTGEVLEKPRRASERFPGAQSLPMWSKDGERLMMTIQRGQRGFVTISMRSGEEVAFPAPDVFGAAPIQRTAWFPDRGFVLVQSMIAALDKSGIHRFDLLSGKTDSLVLTETGKNWNANPQLSPDGNAFYYAHRAFASSKKWTDTIVRRDLQSGAEVIVYAPSEELQIWAPFALSPDGTTIAAVHSDQFLNDDFTVAIRIVDMKSGAAKEILRTKTRENITSIGWTPDGKRLVVTKRRGRVEGQPATPAEVWSLEAMSGKGVPLRLSVTGIPANIAIHPDGRRIAFQTGSRGPRDVWVMEGLFPAAIARAGQ